MKFTTTKRFNACELCGDTSGKCRSTQEDLLLCMTLADGENVPGFRYLGITKDGLWGKFVRDKQNWSKSERDAHQKRLAEKRQKELEAKARSRSNALSEADRDKAIRDIAKSIGLYPRHKEALKARGLTDEQISQGLFFSVTPDQLPNQTPDNLPGVNIGRDGSKYLATSVKGFACVAFNSQGQATGWQIRDENPEADNKYRWAKGIFSSHLKSGELPITIVGNGSSIGLCEGILKPYIAAHKHGLRMIGAAGGNFSGSPKQFKQALGNAREVTIFPDAGDIINPHTYRRWRKQIKFFIKLNLEVKIAWWGQITKDHDDIDELDNLAQIQYLTPQEWHQIAAIEKRKLKAHQQWKEAKKYTADIIINPTDGYLPKSLELPPENSIFAIRSGLGTGKTAIQINWSKNNPQERWISLGYINSLLHQFCQKSGFAHIHDQDVIPRNLDGSLSANLALCIHSILRLNDDDFDGVNLILDEAMSIIKALLFDKNLHQLGQGIYQQIVNKFETALSRAKRVILLDGFLSDKCCEYISQIAPDKKLIKFLNKYQGNQPIINLLEGSENEDGYLNPHDKSFWLYQLFSKLSNQNTNRIAISTDAQVFLETLDYLAKQNHSEFDRIDSKTKAECEIDGNFIAANEVVEFLRNPDDYLEKVKQRIKDSHSYTLGYSPVAASGLDINIKGFFDEVFGCYFWQDVDAIMQQTARIRDNIPRLLFVPPFVPQDRDKFLKSPLIDELKNSLSNQLEITINETFVNHSYQEITKDKLSDKIAQSWNHNLEYALHIQAIENYERANLRECLAEQYRDNGHEVNRLTTDSFKEASERYKQASKEVKKQIAEDIFEADYLPLDTNTRKYGIGSKTLPWKRINPNSEQADLAGIENLSIRKRLPGIEQSDIWNPEFIYEVKFAHPQLINQVELLWLFNHPEVARRQQESNFYHQLDLEQLPLWLLSSRYLFIQGLGEIGIERFLDPDREWRNDAPDLLDLVARAKNPVTQAKLGLCVGRQSPQEFLGKLLKRIGYETKSKRVKDGNRRAPRSGSHRDRLYSIKNPLDSENNKYFYSIYQCLDNRWQKFLDPEWRLDWDEKLSINTQENGSQEAAPILNNHQLLTVVKMAQTTTTQDFQLRPPEPYIYINNQVAGGSNFATGTKEKIDATKKATETVGINAGHTYSHSNNNDFIELGVTQAKPAVDKDCSDSDRTITIRHLQKTLFLNDTIRVSALFLAIIGDVY